VKWNNLVCLDFLVSKDSLAYLACQALLELRAQPDLRIAMDSSS